MKTLSTKQIRLLIEEYALLGAELDYNSLESLAEIAIHGNYVMQCILGIIKAEEEEEER